MKKFISATLVAAMISSQSYESFSVMAHRMNVTKAMNHTASVFISVDETPLETIQEEVASLEEDKAVADEVPLEGESKPEGEGTPGEQPKPEDEGTTEEQLKPEDEGTTEEQPKPEDEGATEEEPKPEDEGTTEEQPKPEDEGTTEEQPKPEDEGTTEEQPKPSDEGTTEEQPKPEAEGTTEEQPKPEAEGTTEEEPKPEAEGTTEEQPKPEDEGTTEEQPKPEDEGTTEEQPKPEDERIEVELSATLAFDINFKLPISSTATEYMTITLNDGLTDIGVITVGQESSGQLSDKVSYTVLELNSKKQPRQVNEAISYVYIDVEGLPLGTYSATVKGHGLLTSEVTNIELSDYSKVVKLGNQEHELTVGEVSDYYPQTLLLGDVNNDQVVNNADYELVKRHLNTTSDVYDLNHDGVVDITDLTYVSENLNGVQQSAVIENTDVIIDPNEIDIKTDAELVSGTNIKDLFTDESSTVQLSTGEAPSSEKPLSFAVDFNTLVTRSGQNVLMEQVVLKAPASSTNPEAAMPSAGSIKYEDESGVIHEISFSESVTRLSNGDVVIDLGNQVAVKKITIDVTGNRGNKTISEIAKIEFLNNVYEEIPEPELSVPSIKTVETSTNLHDERITLSWDPVANVTSYEVKYEKLNDKGQVVQTKTLQTTKPEINILDKDIRPYNLYRVSIQSLNGEWSSGYEFETGEAGTETHPAFDGKADNVDENFKPLDSYYDNLKGSVTEIQVIPNAKPAEPINLVTRSEYRAFYVTWEQHIQARDFDIYYRKLGDDLWKKANENNIEVTQNSEAVTNPNPDYLVRQGGYTVTGLEDNVTYEVRVTATNHLGTSQMSKTYLGSTQSINPPVSTNYKLINRPADNNVGTTHIKDIQNSQHGLSEVDSKFAVVDNDYSTKWVVKNWDTAHYSSNGPTVTFDQPFTIDTIIAVPNLEQGNFPTPYYGNVIAWDEAGNQIVNREPFEKITTKVSNDNHYAILTLPEPITVSKIQVNLSVYGGNYVSLSELKFYEYDSLEDDVQNLYTDTLRLTISEDVTEADILALMDRANTKDEVSGEYHPNRDVLLNELEVALKLFEEQQVDTKIVSLDASLRNNGALGITNDWQSLGTVARPTVNEANEAEQIVVYVGSSDPNTQVQLTFLQTFGQPGAYQGGTVTLRPGRHEITIPTIIDADVEKGGAVMARIIKGSTDADVAVRVINTDDIPHLNVNNLINDATKEQLVKERIQVYIEQLSDYVAALPSRYPESVTPEQREQNIYPYEATTSVLNGTDIEGDRFTLTLPATEVLKGIEAGLNGNLQAQVNRVYDALLAWEQELLVTYAKKGVIEAPIDFNQNGEIDSDETEFYNLHRAPSARLNVKYQRMIMGAAGYASYHHVGIGFNSAMYLQGVPYKFDENKNVINANEATLYDALMGHEIGHVVDTPNRVFPETSNNILPALTMTMLNENSPYTHEVMTDLYEKVTSQTFGLSTNHSVVLGMLWQPHLAYDNDSTYKMLINNTDSDLSNDSYYAKLNRAYRELTDEEQKDADRDQLLIRVSSKVVNRDLTDFYVAHGIIPNATTLKYVSQFEKEARPIQYLNDEARRRRLANDADMAPDVTVNATFGMVNDQRITDGSYVNQFNVPFELSVSNDADHILGYEIYRNGEPAAFVLRDENNDVTLFNDDASVLNNRVLTYEVIAYDYNLNATKKVSLGTVKVRHDGTVSNANTTISTNTIDVIEDNNDVHSLNPNKNLSNVIDKDVSTIYEGRKLTASEYNASIHDEDMKPSVDPYFLLDLNEIKTLVGLTYTAGLVNDQLADGSLTRYKVEVSQNQKEWTTVHEGTFELTKENPSQTIYFNAEDVLENSQLNAYPVRYIKMTAIGADKISAGEVSLMAPPGDNIEIGVSSDNVTYENGLGILKEDFIYQVNDPETSEDETQFIPKGSIVITGEYRGNPAFNVPLVLNQNEEHIADNYYGILLATLPENSPLEEIAEGTWIYWVEPQDATTFMADNKVIFAELYRTDTADLSSGSQRLVSDTFKLAVPNELPEISFSQLKSTNVVTPFDQDDVAKVMNK